MDKKRFILLTTVLLIILSSFVIAAPPFEEERLTGEITIFSSRQIYYKDGEDITLHFHVYNSTGFLLTNETTTCLLHIYNSSSHIYEDYIDFDDNSVDFEHHLNLSNYYATNVYSYNIYCNSTQGEAGDLTDAFEITYSGLDPSIEFGNSTGMVLTFMLIILLFALIGYLNTKAEMFAVGFFSFLMATIQIIVMLGAVILFQRQGNLDLLLTINFSIMTLIGFGIIIYSMFMHSIRIMIPEQEKEDFNEFKKWG